MIALHWTHVAVLLFLFWASIIAYRDIRNCKEFGVPIVGILAIMAAVIISLALLLAKEWWMV